MKNFLFLLSCSILFSAQQSFAQKQDPAATEVWQPEPKIVPTEENQAPSDAFILFDGKNLSEWVSVKDNSPAKWLVEQNRVVAQAQQLDVRDALRSRRRRQHHAGLPRQT